MAPTQESSSQAAISNANLAVDPRFFLFDMNLGEGTVKFIEIEEQALRDSPFHDRRISDFASRRMLDADIERAGNALERHGRQRPGVNYLFHTAFCCSTLISRCLDIPAINLSLREPEILMTLANHRRMRHAALTDPRRRAALLVLATRLLNKTFAPEEQVLVKPTNAANNLIADLLQLPSSGRTVLLYSSLERFLISVIRKGEECRAFTRRLFNVLALDVEQFAIPPRQLMEFTDLQIAALVWYMQIERYRKICAAFKHYPVKTLVCDMFLAHPRDMLERLCSFFGLRVGAARLDAIIDGPAFNKYSKDASRSYDPALREAEYAETKQQHAPALRIVAEWLRKFAGSKSTETALPNALQSD